MRKKTIQERIQEELQYSEELNKKIKKIEKKTTDKKQKIKNNKNTFEFIKEFTYLKEQQKKVENELMVQLYDITPSLRMNNNEDLMKDFYEMMNIERDVSAEFNQIMSFIKTSMKTNEKKVDKKLITSLFETVKGFLLNLKTISQEDYDKLINDNNEEIDQSNSDQITLLFENDVFNTFGINDIDYIIKQELNQAILKSSLVLPPNKNNILQLTVTQKKRIKDNYFVFPFVNYKINQSLYDRAFIALGEIKCKENIEQIEKSFDLINSEYKEEYETMNKSLLKSLIDTTKLGISNEIKLKCSNFIFFIRSLENSVTLTQKLKNYDINSKQIVSQYTSYKKFLDFIFSFKNNFKVLISNYSNDINDLRNSSQKLLQEEIQKEIDRRNDTIDRYDFNQRKKEMNVIHQKNKEMYEIKQKIKNEKKQFEEKLNQKIQREKDEKQRQRNELNKLKAEQYKEIKRENEKKQQEKIKKELEIMKRKQREQIEERLPNIVQKQIKSTNQFIQNQMHKEILKEQKEYNEQRLNYIIENYKTRPQVEADPQRLIAITQNLQNKYDSIKNGIPDQDEKVKMYTNNGFTVEHLMKDFRYKVSSALYEAGILDKQYSKDLLRNLAYAGANNNLQSNINI